MAKQWVVSSIHIADSILCNQALWAGRFGKEASFPSWRENRVVIRSHILHVEELILADAKIVVITLEVFHKFPAAVLHR